MIEENRKGGQLYIQQTLVLEVLRPWSQLSHSLLPLFSWSRDVNSCNCNCNYITSYYIPSQLLLNIDSIARSRKTFILLKIYTWLQELALVEGKEDPILQVAPIGITTFNIIGRTLYSLLQLLVKVGSSELQLASLQALQQLFKDYRFLIINKKSIIDLKTLSLIDDHLQAIFLARSNSPFSSINILIYRDFFQLLLVGRKALFSITYPYLEMIKGYYLYIRFDHIVRLTQVIQQQGEDDTSIRFQAALSELQVL